MQAYGYIRTSTTDQLKKSGPDRQLAAIKSCANVMQLKVIYTYTDDVSGTVHCIERAEFQAMLSAILKNGIKTIIVENLGRLARATNVQSTIIAFLAAKDIRLITADRCADITQEYHDDPTQKAMIQMMGVFFEWEKDIIVARLQAGRQRTGRKGGRPAFYSKELKKRIRRLRKSGNTYGQIADILNAEGVKTSTKEPFSQQLVRIVGGE